MLNKNYALIAYTFGFLPYPIYKYNFWKIKVYVQQDYPLKFNIIQAKILCFLFNIFSLHKVEVIKYKGKYR